MIWDDFPGVEGEVIECGYCTLAFQPGDAIGYRDGKLPSCVACGQRVDMLGFLIAPQQLYDLTIDPQPIKRLDELDEDD